MAGELFSFKAFFLLLKFLLKGLGSPHLLQSKISNTRESQLNFQMYRFLAHTSEELLNTTMIFHVEGALLKTSSLFPYFMLVAFEAGGLLRALVLFLFYPFIILVGDELGLKMMVFVSFFGIKEETFRIGRTVLPKYFLEDVGYEGFDVVMRCGRKVGVSDLPNVMVEGFVRDYLGVEAVIGRELKVVCGYFVGIMEVKRTNGVFMNEILEEKKMDSNVIGIGCLNKSLDQQLFSHCKEICLVSEAEKRNWQILPNEKYPKRLIFHDGRLAFRPTFFATLAMFMWVPLGFLIYIIRTIVGILLPYKVSFPILAFMGIRWTVSRSNSIRTIQNEKKARGVLYVCNHRTLYDPIFISMTVMKPLTAVTYSLSRFSELLAPVKTVRFTRDREKDSKMMEKLLSHGDLVVCPEGTTCREPYLLRFSPLFAELSDEIVPVAIDVQVSMFYGTTASGPKWLDPIFFLLNPNTYYSVKFLEELPRSYSCGAGGKSRYEVANHVQTEIAKALGFECTSLSRKDKYMILAGNGGTI